MDHEAGVGGIRAKRHAYISAEYPADKGVRGPDDFYHLDIRIVIRSGMPWHVATCPACFSFAQAPTREKHQPQELNSATVASGTSHRPTIILVQPQFLLSGSLPIRLASLAHRLSTLPLFIYFRASLSAHYRSFCFRSNLDQRGPAVLTSLLLAQRPPLVEGMRRS